MWERSKSLLDEMKAAVDVAHVMGKKIAIHSYGPAGARDAVRAGADSLEHAVDLDDATLAEMASRKFYYVPTIDHNRYYVDSESEYKFKPGSVEALNAYIARTTKQRSGPLEQACRSQWARARCTPCLAKTLASSMVRKVGHDAGASPKDCHNQRRRSARHEERARPDCSRLLC